MDFLFEYGDAPPDLTITLSGRATPESFRQLVHALRADPRTQRGMVILIDIAALDVSGFGEGQMREAVDPVAEYDWMRPAVAVALLAPTDERFAAATMWRAHLGGSRSNRRVFRSREAALDWLAQKREG